MLLVSSAGFNRIPSDMTPNSATLVVRIESRVALPSRAGPMGGRPPSASEKREEEGRKGRYADPDSSSNLLHLESGVVSLLPKISFGSRRVVDHFL